MPPHPPAQHFRASHFVSRAQTSQDLQEGCGPGDPCFLITTGQGWTAERGHSLLQDTELFTLLEAQVSIVRGIIAVQGDNQVICKDKKTSGRTNLKQAGGTEFRS